MCSDEKPYSRERTARGRLEEFLKTFKNDDLNLEAYKKIFGTEDEGFDALQLIVSKMHVNLENLFNFILRSKYLKEFLNDKEHILFEDEVINRLSFDGKLDILEKLDVLSISMRKKAENLNTLHNRFANFSAGLLQYDGKDIRKDPSVLFVISKDYLSVANSVEQKAVVKNIL